MIEIQGLSVFYKDKKEYTRALKQVNLTIEDGEFLVLAGPSGGGKTTLIKALLDKCEYVNGKIIIDGMESEKLPVKRRNFAYVSQEYTLYYALTVYDNIAFPLRVMRTPRAEIDQRVKSVAKALDIELFLTRKPRQLSGGQQQRVAIAKALVKKPRVLLFDEPFSDLDLELRLEMRKLVKELHEKERPTFVFTTHDAQEAFYLADRIAIINRGVIEQIGKPQDIFAKPETDFAVEFIKNVNV